MCLCLFAGIGKSGDPPGLQTSSEQAADGSAVESSRPAYLGHWRERAIREMVLAEIEDDRPVVGLERTHVKHLPEVPLKRMCQRLLSPPFISSGNPANTDTLLTHSRIASALHLRIFVIIGS